MPLGLHRGMKDCTVPDPHLRFWLSPKVLGANAQGCNGMGYSMIALATKFFNKGGWKVDSFATQRTGMYWDTNVAKGQVTGKFGYSDEGIRYEETIKEKAEGGGGVVSHQQDLAYDIDGNQRVLASVTGAVDSNLMPSFDKWTAAYKLKQSAFSTEVTATGSFKGDVDNVSAYFIGEPMGNDMQLAAYTSFSGVTKKHEFTDLGAMFALPVGSSPTMLRVGTSVDAWFAPTKGLDCMVMPPSQNIAGFKTHLLGRFQTGAQKVGGEDVKTAAGFVAHIEEVCCSDMDAKVKVDYDVTSGKPSVGVAAMWVKGGSAKKAGSWIVNCSIEGLFGGDAPKLGMRIIQGGTPQPL